MELLYGLLNDGCKYAWPFYGKFGKHFSVEGNTHLVECTNKRAIRNAEWPGGRIDFDVPKPPEIVFLVSASAECMDAGMQKGGSRLALFRASPEAVSFYLF